VKWFTWYARRFLRKNFHAVRLALGARPVDPGDGPLVVVLNHPSWWDPMISLLLATLLPERACYAPMDAAGLASYRLLESLGCFGIEPGTRQGALKFLRTGLAVCSHPRTALWITAQGQFTDPRERPVRLRPGVGHLLRRLDGGAVLPLALEYPFWDERYPEALARFGEPIPIGRGGALSAAGWVARVEAALTATQDALAAAARRRDPLLFETLIGGKVGVGGVYDWWRWLTARLSGRRFTAAHGDESTALGNVG
jgi:1-acyl-sn-glycerol-3-phosphate acyltransferase